MVRSMAKENELMEGGLAHSMVTNSYGNGEGQNTQHYYAGTIKNAKRKLKMACKKKKGTKKPSK